MEIRSNIKQVIARVEMFERELPEVIAASASPERWMRPMQNRARLALQAIAERDEQSLVDAFVRTIQGVVFKQGVAWTMEAPTGGDTKGMLAAAAEKMVLGKTTTGRDRKTGGVSVLLGAADIEEARQAVREWVSAPFTGRDDPASGKDLSTKEEWKTPEDVAADIMWILGIHPKQIPGEYTAEMEEAAAKLAPHIEAFWALKMEAANGMSAERIRTWLRAVLEAWRELVSEQLPAKVKQEIRKLWEESGKRLL